MLIFFLTQSVIPNVLEIFPNSLNVQRLGESRRPKWVEMVAPQTGKAVGVDIVCSA